MRRQVGGEGDRSSSTERRCGLRACVPGDRRSSTASSSRRRGLHVAQCFGANSMPSRVVQC
jgi:hypothetical protein